MKIKGDRIVLAGASAVVMVFLIILVAVPPIFADADKDNKALSEEYLSMLRASFYYIMENYVDEPDPKVLYEGAMKGLFDSLNDPYTVYMSSDDLRDISDTKDGEFGGLGIHISKPVIVDEEELRKNPKLNYVEIVAPIEGTPAYKAGLSAGDYIIAIEGNSTKDLTIDEVVSILRGKPNTDVTVTILRGEKITFDVTLTRAIIEIPTVKKAMIDSDIGYLRVTQFTPFTDDRIKDALLYFKENKYQSLIIDLRQNPGGLLDSVIKATDHFFSDGEIVSTKSRIIYENQSFKASPGQIVPDSIPIIVLIDKGSASASEIFSGAIKDRNRGIIIGETSYGKGLVQQVRGIGDGGFKLTISRYYTPAGNNIDKIGIEPDIEVKEPELTEEELESYQQIIEKRLIVTFVEETKEPTDKEINDFINDLAEDDIVLNSRYIKRLIRNEVNRTNNTPPVYDLDFDIVLQRAIEELK